MKAVIFDCFGVIITDVLQAIHSQLQSSQPEKASRLVEAIAASNKGLLQPKGLSVEVAKILDITVDEYLERIRDGEMKDQKLLDFIESLRGQYKTAMLTNISSSASLRRRFNPDELTKYFDVVVVSGDIGFAKPEAQAYVITAQRLGVPLNQCVMIDDVESYCLGAQGVGMRALLYQSFKQMKDELVPLLSN